MNPEEFTLNLRNQVERDIEKIMDRFDRLDNKMDNILERIGRG